MEQHQTVERLRKGAPCMLVEQLDEHPPIFNFKFYFLNNTKSSKFSHFHN